MSVLELSKVDRSRVAEVGGKGANLGELARIDGIRVPDGFCVTVDDFRRDIAAEVARAVARLGEGTPLAVRSSATAEDSPSASFAGQHDSFLNVVGAPAVMAAVQRCWDSLFTERAVAYRAKNGIAEPRMAVVVQKMVPAEAAGVMFTADPLSGNRKVASVEAVRGLGEELVAGRVNPEVLKVRGGAVESRSGEPVLTDAQVVRLVELGRRIEAHFGRPQDIEWCLAGGELWFVQSRPITTLFPIPEAPPGNRVYLSTGHQQMMTDAMRPLGLSLHQTIAARPMFTAGGRLFVDVSPNLATAAGRAGLLAMAGKSDPLTGDALRTVIASDFVPLAADPPAAPPLPGSTPAPLATDPALVTHLIEKTRVSLATLEREIASRSGPALLEFILADIPEFRKLLMDPVSMQLIFGAIESNFWLNEKLEAWLGEKNAADVLTLSVPGNVTSEMGLALMDVADVIRPHPEVVRLLEQGHDDFLERLPAVPGGAQAREAIVAFLASYGMRCAAEIDVTAPRWSERPSTLVPAILGNVRNFEPGAGKRRFDEGRARAAAREVELLARLRELPDGDAKADEVRRHIERVRTYAGYREFPKYGMVSRYFVYKKALMQEAARLVQAGVLSAPDDVHYLTLPELAEVVRTHRADAGLIRERRAAFEHYRTLTPPRVLTSDGECLSGSYRRTGVPAGALTGLAVSAGTVEGRARVIHDIAKADLAPGDILVTTFTDPSWTPLFVGIRGLVTEVGGLMTHGAVIAREYGLPAVVGVPNATKRIADGQRIRVHGTEGYVELL